MRRGYRIAFVWKAGPSGQKSARFSSKPRDETAQKVSQKLETGKQHSSGAVLSSISEVPGWDEALASASESIVKADRSPDKSFQVLQEETLKALERKEGGPRTM